MRNFFKILAYVKGYKKYALLNIFFNILSVVFNLLSLLLFIPFLQLLFREEIPFVPKPEFSMSKEFLEQSFNHWMSNYIIQNGKAETLVAICLMVGALFLLKNVTRYFGMYFIAVIRNGVVYDIRKKVFEKMTRLHLSYYTDARKGDLITRITNDVQEIEWSILSSLELLFREPIAILLFMATMFAMSPQLTVFALVLLPLSGLVIGRLGKSLKRTSTQAQQKLGELISKVEESISGLRVIKAFNAEEQAKNQFNDINTSFTRTMIKAFRKRDLASPLSEFLGALVMISLVYYGGSLVLGGDVMTGEEFLGYIILFSQLINPLKSFSTAINNANKGAASADRVEELLTEEEKITEPQSPVELKAFNTVIEFKKVGFKYGDKTALSDIDITIKKGDTIALVGPSGGGKSTLADLLPKFHEPTEGEVLIDGKNIKDCRSEDVRKMLGVVTQHSILFNDTIFNNIALGTKNATEQQVIEAAKAANAHEFIEGLEKGYYTNIGEGGSKLSGGQRQRICIARALLNDPQILILDEATSALDTESEKKVQQAIENLMKNRTSIVIAHRLSTILNATEIIVLDNGKIIQRGKHEDLIKQPGMYQKLSQMQSVN